MKTDKWTTLSSVIPFIYDVMDEDSIDEGIILEWLYNAMDIIEHHPLTTTDIKFLEVKSHKVKLPCNFHKMEMVIYETNTEKACNNMMSCRNNIDYDLNFYKNISSTFYNLYERGWKIMKKPTGKFELSLNTCTGDMNQLYDHCSTVYGCKESYNLIHTVNGTYLKTSIKDGIIGISYRAKIMDKDEYLIPDDSQFKEALKSYCLMKIWESRWNAKEEGADGRFQYYSSDWAIKKAVVKGKYQMPDSEELEQIRIQRTKLVPKVEQYNKMFSDLDNQQINTFMGQYFPSYE